jgi:putative spermidine/putrescine transport system permease protein
MWRGWSGLALTGPALLLVLAAFCAPLLHMLGLSVSSPELRTTLPETVAQLEVWDGEELPPEEAFAALVRELAEAGRAQAIGSVAARLNFVETGFRTLLLRTARAGESLGAPYRESMPALDARWGQLDTWLLLRQAARPVTPTYLLRAVDLRQTPGGEVVPVEAGSAVFLRLFARSFGIALVTTALCLLLAYPVAHVLANASPRWAAIGMGFVLLPFWTSILVRSTAWFILLQREGPVNALLQGIGLTEAPVQLIFTRTAVYIAMVHVLLPFAVLPLYGTMRRIDPGAMRAAASLGAAPWRSFGRVYLPLTMPGVWAGGLIVFLLSIGFYITPSLVGGPQDQMVSTFIAFFTNTSINWNMAAALSALLLLATLLLVLLMRRLVPGGIGTMVR